MRPGRRVAHALAGHVAEQALFSASEIVAWFNGTAFGGDWHLLLDTLVDLGLAERTGARLSYVELAAQRLRIAG